MKILLIFVFLIILFIIISLRSLLKGAASAVFEKPPADFPKESSDKNFDVETEDANYTERKVFLKGEGEYVNYEEVKD